jgi:hypothetical protein
MGSAVVLIRQTRGKAQRRLEAGSGHEMELER